MNNPKTRFRDISFGVSGPEFLRVDGKYLKTFDFSTPCYSPAYSVMDKGGLLHQNSAF